MIPPKRTGEFVACMERVLDLYKKPYDPLYPVICMDEAARQPVAEAKHPIEARPGKPIQYDFEYKRMGTCSIFLAVEPLAGKRITRIRPRRTRKDWAEFIQSVEQEYTEAEMIYLVMDNLNTLTIGSFYETFDPDEAQRLTKRFTFIHTPKHGSWLNVAEIELSVLARQCLKQRIPEIGQMSDEVEAWTIARNTAGKKVSWQFSTEDARVKLRRLYPTYND